MAATEMHALGNAALAQKLREAAELLQAQRANPFRVGAYRRAAETIEGLSDALCERYAAHGDDALHGLPGIGEGLSAAIAEMLHTGRWSMLDRLRGHTDPVALFRTIPGVGSGLAMRLHDTLGVDTLEALEAAAHDGRLASVTGVGPRRAAALRAALAQMLARTRPAPAYAARPRVEPPVGLLLDVDREYREKAAAHALPTIAPRRFNASGEAWLPVLHAQRGDWHLTALYSNTARAHELHRTRDWVVVYFYDSDHVEGQRTIVTESRGALAGRRVVRGREAECRMAVVPPEAATA